MATKTDNGLSGAIGNIIVYTVNGKQYARSRSGGMRRTKGMKASARHFGQVKRISACLRSGLSEILPGYLSKPVMFCMDAAVGGWYRHQYLVNKESSVNLPHFMGMQLNAKAPSSAAAFLGAAPRAGWSKDGRLQLEILSGASTVLVPKKAVSVVYTLVITASNVRLPVYCGYRTRSSIERKIGNAVDEKIELMLDFPVNKDCLYLAFLLVEYRTKEGVVQEEKWKPVIAVGSCYVA